MPHRLLDGHQIRARLIEMKAESMAKAVEVEAAFGEADSHKRIVENLPDGFRTYGCSRLLSREEPVLSGRPLIG